jgi:hypothetical protein
MHVDARNQEIAELAELSMQASVLHATLKTTPWFVGQARYPLLPARAVGCLLAHMRRLWRLVPYPDSHGSLPFVRRLRRPHGHRLYRIGAHHSAAVHRASDLRNVLLPARAVGRVLVDVLIVHPAARLDGASSELHCEPELSPCGVQLLLGSSASLVDSVVRAAAVRQLFMQGEPGASHSAQPVRFNRRRLMCAATGIVLHCDVWIGDRNINGDVHNGCARRRIVSGCCFLLARGTAVCAERRSVPNGCVPDHADANNVPSADD